MSKTKRIIAAVTAAIITATSSSLISVFADENGGSDFGFVSSGAKTETDNNETVISEAQLYDKLGQLLKDGDSLKYGEALYTTGTPDGEKWTKDFYEQRVEFYGEEFLAKYIVNGEFLRDKVVSDMAEITSKEGNSELNAAAEDINEYMRSNGISGYTFVQTIGGTEKKLLIVFDGFLDKIKSYVAEKGIDESLVEYSQSRDDVIVPDKTNEEKTAAQKYGDAIAEYMADNDIQGVVSRSVPDEKLSIGFHGDHEAQLRAYISEIGLDKSGIPYEFEQLPDFIDLSESVATVKIMDISGDVILVKPVDGSWELKSADKFTLSAKQLPVDITPKTGMKLEITYNGGILETYPAMFGNIQKITVVTETDTDKGSTLPDFGTGGLWSNPENSDFILKNMTLNDVIELSKKGNDLDWNDFKGYNGKDVGSGQYIWEYKFDDGYVLRVIGVTDKKPDYILLSRNNDKGIDIRTEDIKEYIASSATPVSEISENSELKETAEDINEYMRSNGISGSTHVHEDDGVEKIFITYDGFFEKIQAYVVGTGVDENLVVYQQSQDHATGSDKSGNDKSDEDIDFTKGAKTMTLDDVKEIAKKKAKITWSDFADFKGEWSSTDRYSHMCSFELEDGYYLLVEGNPPEALDVIRLYHKDDPDFIDLRYHNVDKYIGEQFLKELKNMSEEELQAFFSAKNMTEEKGFKAWTKETAPKALDNYFLTFLVKLPASFTDKNGNTVINETADIKELSKMADDNSFDEQLNSFLGSLDVNICDQFALSGHFIYRSEGSGDAKVYRRYIAFSVNGTVGSKFTRDEANQMLASALNYIQFSPQFAGFEYESKIPRFGADDKGTLKGDANNDGQVDLADAVLIMQCLANPDKYVLSAEGRANADIDGDGVTVGDAQSIQKRLLNIIDYITDLDTIRTMISDYIADQMIHITVVPKEKMPEQFADKYVFVKWNAPISDGLSYDNFLIKNYIDQSLIKNIPYDIDDDSELNKLCEKLYLYVLENNISAGVHKSKDKVVVEYNWFYKDVREKIETFIKDNSIDPESVIIYELE